MTCITETQIKFILVLINFIFFALGGLNLLIFGGQVQGLTTYLSAFFPDKVCTVALMFFISGIFLFLIACHGCCGLIRESRWMIYMYASCLLVLFALHLTGSIVLFMKHPIAKMNDPLRDVMIEVQQEMVNGNAEESRDAATETWDHVQTMYECCGVDSYKEWFELGILLPYSCYCNDIDSSYCNIKMKAYAQGCYGRLSNHLEIMDVWLSYSGIVIAAFELFTIVAALYLTRVLSKQKKSLVV